MTKRKIISKLSTCNILGVDINITNINDTVKIITENLDYIRGEYICVSNVHTTIMSYEDENYKNIQNNGFMALPDGKPLSIISKIKGYKEAERVTGPDLMESIFDISKVNGYSHYFYGSTQETLDLLQQKLSDKYKNINICGLYSPPFRDISEEENLEIIKTINNVNPDFVWVGLGAPKQEIWMSKNKGEINAVMIGVGAGFDYLSGNIKRAPKWMQRLALEWLYRLIQDPKRLLKRYLNTNIKFLKLCIDGKI